MAKQTLSKPQRKTKQTEVKVDYTKPVLELSVRVCEHPDDKALKANSSIRVFMLLYDELKDKDREHFICLHLNSKNVVIAKETISIGNLNSTYVHPREVFKGALLNGSAGVVFAHNHPSGDPTPSREDIDLTHRLWDVASLIGIRILDHVIIGNGNYCSFADRELLKGSGLHEWNKPRKSKEERQRLKELGRDVRRIRMKLGLTPRKTNDIFFSKGADNIYAVESGRVEPDCSTMKLFTLLDKHPELLVEVANS